MSDVGKLRRTGGARFPTIRKSADPMEPEMGEMDFSREMVEFDAIETVSVHETEKTEAATIYEENRRKQYRQRQRRKKDEEEAARRAAAEQEDSLIDLQA